MNSSELLNFNIDQGIINFNNYVLKLDLVYHLKSYINVIQF